MIAGGLASVLRWAAHSRPSMPGMRISSSTASTACCCTWASASRPLSDSPTTATGNWSAQSASTSRRRWRAGASSSTMRTRRGLGAFTGVGDDDIHLVNGPQRLRLELGVEVEMQQQALADVGQCDAIALVVACVRGDRVAHDDVDLVAAAVDVEADLAAPRLWFDPVVDRVL